MKRVLFSVLLLAFGAVLVLPDLFVSAQVNPPECPAGWGDMVEFSWAPVTKDVQGNPEILDSYQVCAFAQTANMVTDQPLVSSTVPPTSTKVMASFLKAIPQGTKLKLAVRAIDAAGNVSDFSNYLVGTVDFSKPTPPGGFGCSLLR